MADVKNIQVVTKTISFRKSSKLVVKRIGTDSKIIQTTIKKEKVTEVCLQTKEVSRTEFNSPKDEPLHMETDSEKSQDGDQESPTMSTLPHQQPEAQSTNKLRAQLKGLLQSVVRELTIMGKRERRLITAKDVADALDRRANAATTR